MGSHGSAASRRIRTLFRHSWLAMVAEVFRQLVTAASVRRQSISWLGSSLRKRLGGLCCGETQADLVIAREMYSRLRDRVMPTYASRRSSASSSPVRSAIAR